MSIKDVRDYHLKMTRDYVDLKETIDRLESEITEETSAEALRNISTLKKQAEKIQENYNRINYIMYLLDKPVRPNKQGRWNKQNQKRLDAIPNKDRLSGVSEENKNNLHDLKKYI